jgi:hypothetical protein
MMRSEWLCADAQIDAQIEELFTSVRVRKVLRNAPSSAHLRSIALPASAQARLNVRFRVFLKLCLHFCSFGHRNRLSIKDVSKRTTLLRRTYSMRRACTEVSRSPFRRSVRCVSRAICALPAVSIAALAVVEGAST